MVPHGGAGFAMGRPARSREKAMLDRREQSWQERNLLEGAKRATLPFEASPQGRWVRFEGDAGVVYVIRDPWGEGCCVLSLQGAAGKITSHFLTIDEAMREAVRTVGGSADVTALHLDAARAG